jgi:hypothetical protein
MKIPEKDVNFEILTDEEAVELLTKIFTMKCEYCERVFKKTWKKERHEKSRCLFQVSQETSKNRTVTEIKLIEPPKVIIMPNCLCHNTPRYPRNCSSDGPFGRDER